MDIALSTMDFHTASRQGFPSGGVFIKASQAEKKKRPAFEASRSPLIIFNPAVGE